MVWLFVPTNKTSSHMHVKSSKPFNNPSAHAQTEAEEYYADSERNNAVHEEEDGDVEDVEEQTINKDTAEYFNLLWKEKKADFDSLNPANCTNNNKGRVEEPAAVAGQWFEDLCTLIKDVAVEVLPVKTKDKAPKRHVSERTKALFKKREAMTKQNTTKAKFKLIQRLIKESSLLDFTEWVESCVAAMEKADAAGDSRKVFRLVNTLRNKPKPPPTTITRDENGKLLTSPEEKAAVWYSF